MSEVPGQESSAPKPKKTRKVNPNGKKRGPKPKPVTKKIRVREFPDEEPGDASGGLTYETPKPIKTFQETCEYVEVTIMEATDEPREVSLNNGCNTPITIIRGHKCIIPKPYVDTLDEINKIELLKHEPMNNGSDYREYTVPLMRFPYMIHRSGLTYADYRKQMDHFKTLKDPWDKAANQNR